MDENIRFLYIEDHAASRQVLELLLTKMLGFKYLTMLKDTVEIEKQLENLQGAYDVVFLDLNITPIDGWEVCKLLRASGAYREARIVALTATITPAQIRKLRESGFDGVITKPINHQSFPGFLDRIIHGDGVWEDD